MVEGKIRVEALENRHRREAIDGNLLKWVKRPHFFHKIFW